MIPLNKKFICPYCGYIDSLYSFLVKKKDKSISTKIVKCGMCSVRMKKATLINDMSIYEWGLWLYLNIRLYDAYDKVDFKRIYRALHLMGSDNAKEFTSGFSRGKEIYRLDGNEALKTELEEIEFKYNLTSKAKSRNKLDNYT